MDNNNIGNLYKNKNNYNNKECSKKAITIEVDHIEKAKKSQSKNKKISNKPKPIFNTKIPNKNKIGVEILNTDGNINYGIRHDNYKVNTITYDNNYNNYNNYNYTENNINMNNNNEIN